MVTGSPRAASPSQGLTGASSLVLTLSAIFTDIAGLFEIRVSRVGLDSGFLLIRAEFVGDLLGFGFHEQRMVPLPSECSTVLALFHAYLVTS